MPARATGERLFGSISAADIVRQVETLTGAVVDRKDLVLDEPNQDHRRATMSGSNWSSAWCSS